jgi:hypothetical protein
LFEIQKWLNDNEGVLSVAIFLITLFLGWISGIFTSLRRRPKLNLSIIPGPTLCATFETGEKHNDHAIHRTGISVYLRVSNIGAAATSIENVLLGYHWHLRPTLSLNWIRYRLFWYWLRPVVTMEDFHTRVSENIKIYPSLIQGTAMTGQSIDVYVQSGQTVNGVVYFEQDDSWGGCMPLRRSNQTLVKLAVKDTFGAHHKKRFWIPVVTLAEAQKYNPSFGKTFQSLRQGVRSACT